MLSIVSPVFRFATVFLIVTVFGVTAVYFQAAQKGSSLDPDEIQRQLDAVKAEIEQPNSPPDLIRQYERLVLLLGKCATPDQTGSILTGFSSLSPSASLCVNGSLAVADPDYNRVLMNSTGTGIGNGTPGNCSLSGTATAANYDAYAFNLTGCAAFPTEVTVTLCGPAGCQHAGNVDTTLVLYRNVPAGDPLTANGGLPGVFNPASACTNARGGQDDLGTTSGTPNNPGGATCNQVIGANCVGPCTTPSNAGGLSGFRRQLGNGRFTVVVGGFGNATTGNYNLYVDAPAAGCNVALAPTAANAGLSGRVVTADGRGIRNVVVTISGGNLSEPKIARTGSFGYYGLEGLEVGETYIVTVQSKRFTFAEQSRVISLQDNFTDADFVAEP